MPGARRNGEFAPPHGMGEGGVGCWREMGLLPQRMMGVVPAKTGPERGQRADG